MDDRHDDDRDGPAVDPHPMEDRLRAALTAGADAADRTHGVPVADGDDLARRRRRHARRRTRLAGAAAAGLLVVTGAGAFTVGRQGRIEARAEAPSVVDGLAAGRGRSEVDIRSGVRLPVVSAGGDPVGAEGGAGGAPRPSGPDGVVRADMSWGGGGWYSGQEPTATLFTRTLADGTVLDVRANRYPAGMTGADLVPFWAPAAWCYPSGSFYVGVRAPGAVGQAGGQRYDAVRPGDLSVSGTVTGRPENAPRWVVLAQVPEGTTTVRATFPDGRTDAFAPVDGTAILSSTVADGHDLTPSGYARGGGVDEQTMTIEAVADSGRVVARYAGPLWGGFAGDVTRSDDNGDYFESDDPSLDPVCQPPTELPAPGPAQPADPAAAEATVRDVWNRAVTMDGPDVDPAAVLDDATGVAEARRDLRESGMWEMAKGATTPIDGVVFADPTTAYFRYTLVLPASGGDYGRRFGEARLIDGTWKITRASVCDLLAVGGVSCDRR